MIRMQDNVLANIIHHCVDAARIFLNVFENMRSFYVIQSILLLKYFIIEFICSVLLENYIIYSYEEEKHALFDYFLFDLITERGGNTPVCNSSHRTHVLR